MKPIYIFSTRLRTFWVLLPMAVLLYLSIIFNDDVEMTVKLYPLIIFSALCIVFTLIYLFRMVEISYSEIRYIGRFSSRDNATIKEGRTLVIEMSDSTKVDIKLYGNEGYNPEIVWLRPNDAEPEDICIFRGKGYCGKITATKILSYFGVDKKDLDNIFSTDGFSKQYTNVTVSTCTENEHKQIKIHMDKTV